MKDGFGEFYDVAVEPGKRERAYAWATAMFAIKYLRSKGFDVTNDLFARESWYFRNALVRANYENTRLDVAKTTLYLEDFLKVLICGTQIELKNRYLRIGFEPVAKPRVVGSRVPRDRASTVAFDLNGPRSTSIRSRGTRDPTARQCVARGFAIASFESGSAGATAVEKIHRRTEKLDIETEKLDIGVQKLDIGNLPAPTRMNIKKLQKAFASAEYFKRGDAVKVLDLSPTAVSNLLARMRGQGVIETVPGRGKGAWRFVPDVCIFPPSTERDH